MLARVKELRETLLGDETRRKVAAWWRGEDVPATVPADEPGAADAGPPAGHAPVSAIAHRVTVTEHLWGHGNLNPGDTEFLRELGVQLGLTKEMSLGFFGVGLAGAARALVTETGVWVTAFDENPEIAAAATEQNSKAGLAKKITLTVGPFESLALPAKKFDHIIAKDVFARVQDKARLAEQITGALKPGGSFVFAEYVAPGEALTPEELKTYFSPDSGTLALTAGGECRALIEAQGFEVRVDENVTTRYADYATSGWSNLRKLLDGLGNPGEALDRTSFMRAVAEEAALWAHRIEAFRSGRLAVYRFVAIKGPEPIT